MEVISTFKQFDEGISDRCLISGTIYHWYRVSNTKVKDFITKSDETYITILTKLDALASRLSLVGCTEIHSILTNITHTKHNKI